MSSIRMKTKRGKTSYFYTVLALLLYIFAVLIYLSIKTRALQSAKAFIDTDSSTISDGYTIGPITEEFHVDENFLADFSRLSAIYIRTITWDRTYRDDDLLIIEIMESGTSEILSQQNIPAEILPDNNLLKVDFHNLKLEKGKWYTLRFRSNISSDRDSFCLYKNNISDTAVSFLVQDNTNSSWNINLIITGK